MTKRDFVIPKSFRGDCNLATNREKTGRELPLFKRLVRGTDRGPSARFCTVVALYHFCVLFTSRAALFDTHVITDSGREEKNKKKRQRQQNLERTIVATTTRSCDRLSCLLHSNSSFANPLEPTSIRPD